MAYGPFDLGLPWIDMSGSAPLRGVFSGWSFRRPHKRFQRGLVFPATTLPAYPSIGPSGTVPGRAGSFLASLFCLPAAREIEGSECFARRPTFARRVCVVATSSAQGLLGRFRPSMVQVTSAVGSCTIRRDDAVINDLVRRLGAPSFSFSGAPAVEAI